MSLYRVPGKKSWILARPRCVYGEGDAYFKELKVKRRCNCAAHACQGGHRTQQSKKAAGIYARRPFVLFTDLGRSDLRSHLPPILADIAEDEERPPVLLF